MSISKIRSLLYGTAKFLGDVQAVTSCSPKKMINRVIRRQAGRTASIGLSKFMSFFK